MNRLKLFVAHCFLFNSFLRSRHTKLLLSCILLISIISLPVFIPDSNMRDLFGNTPVNIIAPPLAYAQVVGCNPPGFCLPSANACDAAGMHPVAICDSSTGSMCCEPNPPPPPKCKLSNCGACNIYNANTCNNGNTSQTCYVNTPAGCTGGYQYNQVCGTTNACFANYACVGGACTPYYTVSIHVYDPATQDGINSIDVKYDGNTYKTSHTGNINGNFNGNIIIPHVYAGSRTASVIIANLPNNYEGVDPSVTKTVNGDTTYNLKITQLFKVSGRVTDPKNGGSGINNATVHLDDTNDANNTHLTHTDNTGGYTFSYVNNANISRGTYKAYVDPPTNNLTPPDSCWIDIADPDPINQTVTVGNADVSGVKFNITKQFTISGRVLDPYNSLSGVDGVKVFVDGETPAQKTQDSNGTSGNYTFDCSYDLEAGPHTVTLNTPPFVDFTPAPHIIYTNMDAPFNTPQTATVNTTVGDATGVNFHITPLYSISGNIFQDLNVDKKEDGTEGNYTMTQSKLSYNATNTLSDPNSTQPNPPYSTGDFNVNSDGTYTINNLIAGPVTVTFHPQDSSLPTNYHMTVPLNGPPPEFDVTIGVGNCTKPGSPDATCTNGNLSNLNFGFTDTSPWIQSLCGDIRSDAGFANPEPAGQSTITNDPTNIICSTAPAGSLPGILFSGQSAPSLTAGDTSNVVGDTTNYDTDSSNILSSYDYLSAKAIAAGLPEVDLATGNSVINNIVTGTNIMSPPCGIGGTANCTLSPNLPHGIYTTNGNVNVNGYKFPNPPNQNYVFLIKGNLIIKDNIIVPPGDTVVFAVYGKITVNANVGWDPTTTTLAAAAPTNLQGIYITDQSFVINSKNTCPDLGLKVGGTIIVNATHTGGTLQNNRDLCQYNQQYPDLDIAQRPDFLLNLPDFVRSEQTVSQEVAP